MKPDEQLAQHGEDTEECPLGEPWLDSGVVEEMVLKMFDDDTPISPDELEQFMMTLASNPAYEKLFCDIQKMQMQMIEDRGMRATVNKKGDQQMQTSKGMRMSMPKYMPDGAVLEEASQAVKVDATKTTMSDQHRIPEPEKMPADMEMRKRMRESTVAN